MRKHITAQPLVYFFFAAIGLLSSSATLAGEAERLREAEKIATQQDASSAIGAYQDLVGDGVDGAEVRYNLGTLYLEEAQTARAVFHLKTALLFDPLHSDARHNLQVAIAMRTDAVGDVETGRGLSLDVARRVPRDLAALVTGLFALLLGLAIGLRSVSPRLHRSNAWTGVVMVIWAVMTTALVALVLQVAATATQEAVVMADETTARLGPSDDAKESFVAHAGLVGTAIEERDGFVRLRLKNGLEAWVNAYAVARVDGSSRLP